MLIREVYPNLRLEIMSAREATNSSLDLDCDIILVGGPDYNDLVERLQRDGRTRITYQTPDWSKDPPANECEIALQHNGASKTWSDTDRQSDHGYIEVIPSPFEKSRRIFFFGGCHTIGVTAAARVFQLKRKQEAGLTKQALENLKGLNRFGFLRSGFGVVFKASLVGATIPPPTLKDAFFFGADPKLFGLALPKKLPKVERPGVSPPTPSPTPGAS